MLYYPDYYQDNKAVTAVEGKRDCRFVFGKAFNKLRFI